MHAKVGVADVRDNGNFMMKSSTASVLSQLSKLVLGSACFVVATVGAMSATTAGMNSAKKAIFANTLSVSPKLISWTTDLHPAFKTTATNVSLQSPLDAVAANSFSEGVSAQVHQGLNRIVRLEKVQRLAMRRARIVHPHIVLAKAKPVLRDEVKVSQSSTELAKAVVFTPMTEAEKLQGVQAALVSHFMLAMNDSPKVNTQLAMSSETPESVATQAKIDSVLRLIAPQAPKPASHAAVVKTAAVKEKEAEVADETSTDADDSELADLETTAKTIKTTVPQKTVSESAKVASADSVIKTGAVSSQTEAVKITQPVAANTSYPPSALLILKNTSTPPQATASPAEKESNEEQPAATYVGPSTTAAVIAPPSSAVASMALAASKMWGSGYSKPAPTEYSKAVAKNTQTVATPDNQKAFKPTTHELPSVKPLAPGKSSAMVDDKISTTSAASYNVSTPLAAPLRPSFGPLLDRTSRWAFHEAFDWNTSVTDPRVEILSQEGAIPDQVQARGQSTGQTLGWRIAKANQHWATLFWSTPNQEEVPMLNALSAKMLSVKASAALQTDAGIILAKVPAGWSLEFSGRSERPLIFDRTNHILAPSATEGSNGGERYYVFLNAAPGEQILYLNHAGGETGALAVPVLGGVMAYADLTQLEKRTISGRILEAAENSPRGVAGIHVQVVGSGMSTVTGNTGEFHIDNVIAFGDQNFYIEAETQKSFPHRYKLSPSETTHLSLFHLNESQVHEWISQLEGGVSSESGLILGALPTLAASQEDRKPTVGTRSLANGPTLTPETYTLSGSGQLMVKTPLSGVRSRFISVQVPEGPTLVEVVDKDNRLIWSEITVVSPRVLTIVGPY
jgi:peptidoglycan hydrolase-like protein with peptidoglycan-binding domain